MNISILKHAGLTEGESKVYLALIEIGTSTTGPIIEKSGVARSFIYNLLEKLIDKGLVSHSTKGGKRLYTAADPERILNYLERKQQQIEDDKKQVKKTIPLLRKLQEQKPRTAIQVFEGYRGIQTAFEKYGERLKKGDEMLGLGIPAIQEEKYHEYWNEFHEIRMKKGIKDRMLFNKGTSKKIINNRNSRKGTTAKIMQSDIKTPSWLLIYKDVTTIFLQDKQGPLAIEIINKQITETFRAYFEDYWKKAK